MDFLIKLITVLPLWVLWALWLVWLFLNIRGLYKLTVLMRHTYTLHEMPDRQISVENNSVVRASEGITHSVSAKSPEIIGEYVAASSADLKPEPKAIACNDCRGSGYIHVKCIACDGSGTVIEDVGSSRS